MRPNRASAPPAPAPILIDPIKRGFGVMLAILGSMFIAARPLAYMHDSTETAYAGVLAVCFIALAGVAALREKNNRAPENLVVAVILWTALFIWGALRSPYPGASLPQATDAIFYALLLLAGYFAARIEPALRVIFIRAIIAMAAVEAAFALWQVFVELPRLRKAIATGEVIMPEALASRIGLDRLAGNDAQGTFGNPNSLAAFLLVGFFLLLGHCWEPLVDRFRRREGIKRGDRELGLTLLNIALALFLLIALFITSSKGAWVALVVGLWFFALQFASPRHRILKLLTINAFSAGLLLIALVLAGVLPSRSFGLSMEVRFEYWKAAWAMFWKHPLQGVGLAGYGEWYNQYKSTMGWEVRDPHNEYLCFLAELGMLGLALYALLWRLVFKHARLAPASSVPEASAEPKKSLLSNAHFVSALFGTLSLYLAIFAVGVFNSPDIIALMRKEWSWSIFAGALQTVLLPILFALVIWLLHTDAKTHAAATGATSDASPAPLYGFRAAAGAILVHQLVDFDFKAQAVMCALLLCGGLFWGCSDASKASDPATEPPPSILSRLSVWLAPAFALLLIPTGVWIPLQYGSARADADDIQSEFARFMADPLREAPLEKEEVEKQIVAVWRRAAAAAPFDAVPLTALADAKYQFEKPRVGKPEEDELFDILKRAEQLRPLSPQIKLKLATLYFRRGLQEASGNIALSNKNLELALEKFREARAVYPLRPAHSLMEGDALIFLGRTREAIACYERAFEIDVAINDYNEFLSSIFTDPRPNAFVNHSQNIEVLQAISPYLISSSTKPPVTTTVTPPLEGFEPGSPLRFALLVRHMVGLAQQIDADSHRYGQRTPGNVENINRQKAQLLKTTEELREIAPDIQKRAHSALLFALCLKGTHLLRRTSLETLDLLPKDMRDQLNELDWKNRCQIATNKAIALQAESIKQNRPGTTRWVFDYLLNILRKE